MANFNADNATAIAAVPPTKVKVNKQHGRQRHFESTIVVPVGGIAIADTITWGTLPAGCRIVGHQSQLNWATGAASSTLNVGDAAVPARHLAATAVATAGVAITQAQSASGASFETSDNSVGATNNCTLLSTVAGAALLAGQVITLRVTYVLD